MNYVLKYIDEYNKEHYYSETVDDFTIFSSVDKAFKTAKSLLNSEFEVFGQVLTDYHVIRIDEEDVKHVEYLFYFINDDSVKLSANNTKFKEMKKLAHKLIDIGCTVEDKKVYKNKSAVIILNLNSVAREDVEKALASDNLKKATVDYKDGELTIAYNADDFVKMQSIVMVAKEYFKEEITSVTTDLHDNGTYTTHLGINSVRANTIVEIITKCVNKDIDE